MSTMRIRNNEAVVREGDIQLSIRADVGSDASLYLRDSGSISDRNGSRVSLVGSDINELAEWLISRTVEGQQEGDSIFTQVQPSERLRVATIALPAEVFGEAEIDGSEESVARVEAEWAEIIEDAKVQDPDSKLLDAAKALYTGFAGLKIEHTPGAQRTLKLERMLESAGLVLPQTHNAIFVAEHAKGRLDMDYALRQPVPNVHLRTLGEWMLEGTKVLRSIWG